jgi:hypothetical protein
MACFPAFVDFAVEEPKITVSNYYKTEGGTGIAYFSQSETHW